MTRRKIIITAEDFQRLEALLTSNFGRVTNERERLDELHGELNRAQVVRQDEVPGNVVTMNSVVTLRDLDTDEIDTYTLVYPDCADIANYKLSVLAPIGTAILGYRVGDELRWRVPDGWRRLKVEQVVFQPERDGALRLYA
ncbi:MAG: nucleoside diphosphate kinase regulator [Pirellulales bacterium]|jgi:regulator of nucleoside diphosphate kinase